MCPAVTGDSLIIHHQHSHLLAEIGPHLLHLLPPEAAGGGQQLVDILAVLTKNICSLDKKYFTVTGTFHLDVEQLQLLPGGHPAYGAAAGGDGAVTPTWRG